MDAFRAGKAALEDLRLPYFLAYGSALSALREGQFQPQLSFLSTISKVRDAHSTSEIRMKTKEAAGMKMIFTWAYTPGILPHCSGNALNAPRQYSLFDCHTERGEHLSRYGKGA